MEKNKAPHMPSELIIEILVRLPVKSLIRFKRVCKSWFSLISNPNFANSQFHLSQPTHNCRILSSSRLSLEIRSIDFESSRNHKSASLVNVNSLPQHYFPLEIKASCRGFLLLCNSSKFYLWNPCTGFHRRIPLSPLHSKFKALYGFGYDQSRDDYLLVSFSYDDDDDLSHWNIFHLSHLEYFSLRDNTWKDVEGTHFTYWSPFSNCNLGSLINEAIHWLAFRGDLMVGVIVVFDLMERKLLEIPLPVGFDYYHKDIGLWVSREFLNLWVRRYNLAEIWVMKEYKVHSSWTKTHVFPILDDYIPYFSPIYSTKNGDVIGTVGGTRLLKYNSKGHLLEECSYCDNPHGSQVVLYTESLLSLPGDIEQV